MSATLNGPFEDALQAAQQAGQAFLRTPVGQQLAQQAGQAVTGALKDQLAANVRRVTFYTAYSAPISYTGAQLAALVPKTGAKTGIASKSLIDRVKPTLVVETAFGSQVFAPYGAANPADYGRNIRNLVVGSIGILLLYTAGSYYLGFKAGQRSRGA